MKAPTGVALRHPLYFQSLNEKYCIYNSQLFHEAKSQIQP
jgi:hypothetical protein